MVMIINVVHLIPNGFLIRRKIFLFSFSWEYFFRGKNDRRDVYQAPYIWVQFNNPQPNILINVICRVFAKNIYFDRKTARGLTRFQIYIKDVAQAKSSN
jgi:hypothetical protein